MKTSINASSYKQAIQSVRKDMMEELYLFVTQENKTTMLLPEQSQVVILNEYVPTLDAEVPIKYYAVAIDCQYANVSVPDDIKFLIEPYNSFDDRLRTQEWDKENIKADVADINPHAQWIYASDISTDDLYWILHRIRYNADMVFVGEKETPYACPNCNTRFRERDGSLDFKTGLIIYTCHKCDWRGDETEVIDIDCEVLQ